MVLTAITLCLLLGQQTKKTPPGTGGPGVGAAKDTVKLPNEYTPSPAYDVGTSEEAILNITKHIPASFDPNMIPQNGSWAGGQDQDIREGEMSFSLTDGTWEGKPCKYFRGISNWDYRPNVRNKKVVFTPKLYVFAHISPDGKLLHMTTAYNGFGIAAPVQIESVFNDDSIDITKTMGSDIERSTLYPKFSMDIFNHLFDPLVKDGLVVSKDRDIAFIHPVTGALCQVHISLNGRFDGEMEYRKYEGYKVDVTSPDTMSKATSMVTRHGQLIQVNLPENQDAVAYTNISTEEERNWGRFQPGDWDKPASVTQPSRTRYHTFSVPILLKNPSYILMPFPYAMAL